MLPYDNQSVNCIIASEGIYGCPRTPHNSPWVIISRTQRGAVYSESMFTAPSDHICWAPASVEILDVELDLSSYLERRLAVVGDEQTWASVQPGAVRASGSRRAAFERTMLPGILVWSNCEVVMPAGREGDGGSANVWRGDASIVLMFSTEVIASPASACAAALM
eukprot:6858458-Prymnesium_polylepis.1